MWSAHFPVLKPFQHFYSNFVSAVAQPALTSAPSAGNSPLGCMPASSSFLALAQLLSVPGIVFPFPCTLWTPHLPPQCRCKCHLFQGALPLILPRHYHTSTAPSDPGIVGSRKSWQQSHNTVLVALARLTLWSYFSYFSMLCEHVLHFRQQPVFHRIQSWCYGKSWITPLHFINQKSAQWVKESFLQFLTTSTITLLWTSIFLWMKATSLFTGLIAPTSGPGSPLSMQHSHLFCSKAYRSTHSIHSRYHKSPKTSLIPLYFPCNSVGHTISPHCAPAGTGWGPTVELLHPLFTVAMFFLSLPRP